MKTLVICLLTLNRFFDIPSSILEEKQNLFIKQALQNGIFEGRKRERETERERERERQTDRQTDRQRQRQRQTDRQTRERVQ